MLSSNNIGDHVLSLKFEPNQQKNCISQQFSSNSPENLQIIANAQLNKFRDPVLSPKSEPKQQKICILQQFSDNSPENLQRIKMLSSS